MYLQEPEGTIESREDAEEGGTNGSNSILPVTGHNHLTESLVSSVFVSDGQDVHSRHDTSADVVKYPNLSTDQ